MILLTPVFYAIYFIVLILAWPMILVERWYEDSVASHDHWDVSAWTVIGEMILAEAVYAVVVYRLLILFDVVR